MENKEMERIFDFFRGRGFLRGRLILFGTCPIEDEDAKMLIKSGIPADDLLKLIDSENYAEKFLGFHGFQKDEKAYSEWKNCMISMCEKYGLNFGYFFDE